MNDSKIPVRYAKALFQTALSHQVLEEIERDVRKIMNLYRDSDDFMVFLQSTVIRKSKKATLFSLIFSENVHPLTMRFLLLLTEKRREDKLPDICRNLLDLIREHQGITPVMVTTATPLTGETRNSIRQYLTLQTGRTIELSEKVQPGIIGGLILRIGDLQFDGSISHQLKKVRESLLNREVI
jgi:F-type H+-transporting ATPase subunit delta